jgi:hypothetical protein
MKVQDFIEAIETAAKAFEESTGKPMEIFNMAFYDDDFNGDMRIEASADVIYSDGFGYGETIGREPNKIIRIHFEVENGKIADRAISIEDETEIHQND